MERVVAMGVVRYLIACAAFGLGLGHLTGSLTRGSWRYPSSLAHVPPAWRRFLLFYGHYEAVNFVCVALVGALLLWRLLRSRRRAPLPGPSAPGLASLLALLYLIAAGSVLSASGRELAPLTLTAAVVYALSTGWFLWLLWAEACAAAPAGFLRRFLAAAPLSLGHGLAVAATVFTLGYRGESAMIYIFVLMLAVGLALVELALAAALAAAATRCVRDAGSAGSRRAPARTAGPTTG